MIRGNHILRNRVKKTSLGQQLLVVNKLLQLFSFDNTLSLSCLLFKHLNQVLLYSQTYFFYSFLVSTVGRFLNFMVVALTNV